MAVRADPPLPCHSFGGSVWESNPSTVCLERSTGFEVREAHRVPRRFQSGNYHPFSRCEFTIGRSPAFRGTVRALGNSWRTDTLGRRPHDRPEGPHVKILGISGLEQSVPFKKAHWPNLDEREYRISQGHDSAAALIVDG